MSGLDNRPQAEQSENDNPASKKLVSRLQVMTSHIQFSPGSRYGSQVQWSRQVAVSRATWVPPLPRRQNPEQVDSAAFQRLITPQQWTEGRPPQQ